MAFFENYLAAPIVFALYVFWKIKTRGAGGFYIRGHQMDLMTGMRAFDLDPMPVAKKSLKNLPMRTLQGLF